ncbi:MULTISPECIES: hypothetical protein [unclassified Pseudoalteromonas]|uniref:hypothetical protein n=2 Tax=Pseudoalteromonas TaxID=53246 RepID=UPI00332BE676
MHHTIIKPNVHTTRVSDFELSSLHDGEVAIISSDSFENRGDLDAWNEIKGSHKEQAIIITPKSHDQVIFSVKGGAPKELSLRNDRELANVLNDSKYLIDITSFRHNVWAPIIKNLLERGIQTRALYIEPDSYKPHPNPSSETTFDLTNSFEGMLPLPGFSNLNGPDDENKCIAVALLGFEGSRPQRLIMSIDPEPKVFSVIGIPGFKLNYPSYTVTSNSTFLNEYGYNGKVLHARASCPFELYNLLLKIKQDYPEHYLYIAPVGTKPHALGAIMFNVDHGETTEIIYDNPSVKKGRTEGRANIHIYNLWER